MVDFHIRLINLDSDEEMRQLNALDEACDQEMFGAVERLTVAERRAMLEPSAYKKVERFVAESEGRIVGISVCGMPLEENKDTAMVGVAVAPDFRGQGIGSALAEQVVACARENGRSQLTGWGHAPAGVDADDDALPWNRLADRMGMAPKNVSYSKTLSLPLELARLEKMEAVAVQKLGNYRIETWADDVPEDQLENYGLMLRQLDMDEPTGDHKLEAADYPAERVKESRERLAAMGYKALITVAFSASGEIAGHTEINYKNTEGTTLGYQENTLVMPDHRGHALGLAMKVANHRQLQELAPHLDVLVTGNSSLNTHMNAINEQFGYEVAFQEIAYQS